MPPWFSRLSSGFLSVVLLIAAASPAFAAPSKLDAPLRALKTAQPEKLKALARFISVKPEAPYPRVGILIRLRPDVSLDELSRAYPEARFGSQIGPIVTGEAPINLLDAFERDSNILRVEHSARRKPNLNIVRSTTTSSGLYLGVFQSTVDLPQNGSGVVIGNIDTGIDWTHPDFHIIGSTLTRILSIWDQTGGGEPAPARFNYGAECTSTVINEGTCPEQDTDGHGTHTTGIAAGNGQGTGNGFPSFTYVGMASTADIVMVNSDLTDHHIIDGMNYIIRKAKTAGKRAVINMSFGSQDGPHDGTSALDTAIGVVAASTPIAVAMGNDNANAPHASFVVGAGSSYSTTVTAQTTMGDNFYQEFIITEFWYPAADDYSLTVDISGASSGHSAYFSADNVANGMTKKVGYYSVQVNSGANGDSSANEIYITVDDNQASDINSVTYTLHRTVSRGSGQVDGYTDPSINGTSFDNASAAADGTITEPATADNVFAVAAYNSKNSWTDQLGELESYEASLGSPQPQLGYIADFSGMGPRRARTEGFFKPDLAAPGQGIASALSAQSLDHQLDCGGGNYCFILKDGVHVIEQGTSMATPIVTGYLAMKLKASPGVSTARLHLTLAQFARSDAQVGATPNTTWGYGKLLANFGVDTTVASLAGHALGISSVEWTWSAMPGAAGYEFAPSTGGAAIELSQSSITFNGLSPNTAYSGSIRATNDEGAGPFLTAATVYTLVAPTTGFSLAGVYADSITVQWANDKNPNWTSYYLDYWKVGASSKTAPSVPLVAQIGTGFAQSTATIKGLTPNTPYNLRVRAKSGILKTPVSKSILSNPDLDNPILSTTTLASHAPTAFPSVTATTLGVSSITWTWPAITGVKGASSYIVRTSTDGWTAETILPATQNFITLTSIATNTAAGVQVQAHNIWGSSKFSKAATGYTLAEPPSELNWTGAYLSTITIAWDRNTNPSDTEYVAHYWDKASGTKTAGPFLPTDIFVTSAAYTLGLTKPLTPATTYRINVQALNKNPKKAVYTHPSLTISTGTWKNGVPPTPMPLSKARLSITRPRRAGLIRRFLATISPVSDQVGVTILGKSGILIRRILIVPGSNQALWDGTDKNGRPVPPGTYYVLLESSPEGDAKRFIKIVLR